LGFIAHINSLLSDSVLDSLRTPTDNAYRNDPDISPYVPDLFYHFVGRGLLHTDAVEPRRAPLPPASPLRSLGAVYAQVGKFLLLPCQLKNVHLNSIFYYKLHDDHFRRD